MATATRTTARKTVAPEVEYDFDGWSEEAEEAALAALADGFRYIIVGPTFVGQFTSGLILEVSLNLTAEQADVFETDGTVAEQITNLLKTIGAPEKLAGQAAKQPIHEVGAFLQKYQSCVERVMQDAVGRLQRASLGE